MRWPLRNQVFLPFAVLLTIAVIVVTIVNAWRAVQLQRDREEERMRTIAASLGDASFPLTQDIITRVKGMVGGEVIVLTADAQLAASTLPETPGLVENLKTIRPGSLQSLQTESLVLGNDEYLVGAIRRTHAASREVLYVLSPRTRFGTVVRDSVVPPLVVAIPTLLVALLIAMLLSQRVGGRVERLQRLFQNLADGEFQSVAVDGRNDELRDLLGSANELSQRLDGMQQELVRVQRLELLSQLSGGLAHQLRNSITGARLAIQMHAKQCQTDPTGMLRTALAQLKLTEQQVEAVLSLRKGPERNQQCEFNVATMMDEVIELTQPQAAHWNTAVRRAGQDDVVWALASPAAMKGAILNLTINAIEAAGANGVVQLDLRTEADSLSIEVLDSGPGFDAEFGDLTEAFRTTKRNGIGLGLTIARHAVKQEGGELRIGRVDDRTSVRCVIPKKHTAHRTNAS